MCLSIKTSAVIQRIYLHCVPPCHTCHPVPGGLWGGAATCCTQTVTILLSHMGHITFWKPFEGQLVLESTEKKASEREDAHTHTHIASLTHASFLCSNENSGSLVNFSSWVTGSYRAVDSQFDGYISVWDSFKVCIHGTSAAMIKSILLSHLFSINIKTFRSLARWSLECNEVMGSCVRFGDRGLLFILFVYGVFSSFYCFHYW